MKTIDDKELKAFIFKLRKVMYTDVIWELKITNNTDECEPHLYLDIIKVRKKYRNQGWGSEILKEIVRFADKHNVQVQLYASDLFGTDLKGLYRFYRKHNFVLIKNNKENKFVHRPKKIKNVVTLYQKK